MVIIKQCIQFCKIYYSITLNNSGISHITHLSGLIIGFLYLKYWAHHKKSEKIIKLHNNDIFTDRMNKQKEMNKILDKVTNVGWDGLSNEDKEFLKEQSKNQYDSNGLN